MEKNEIVIRKFRKFKFVIRMQVPNFIETVFTRFLQMCKGDVTSREIFQ